MLLKKTVSICPVCRKIIDAEVVSKNDKVFMEKECEKHGHFSGAYIWDSLDLYRGLKNIYEKDIKLDLGKNVFDTPLANTIFIPITSKCNLNCPICFVPNFIKSQKDPSIEDIVNIVKISPNIKYVLTGGEPTTRNDLPKIISTLVKMGLYVNITTNGIKFMDIKYIKKLKDAGLQQVKITLSFDDLKERTYVKLRGRKLLKNKLDIIKNLRKVCVNNIDIVMTVSKEMNEKQIGYMIDFCMRNQIRVLVLRSLLLYGQATKTNLKETNISEMLKEVFRRCEITIDDIIDYSRYRFFYDKFMCFISNIEYRKKICGIACEIYSKNDKYLSSTKKISFKIKYLLLFALWKTRFLFKPFSKIFIKIEKSFTIEHTKQHTNKLQIFISRYMNPLNLDLELLKSSCRCPIVMKKKLYSPCIISSVLKLN
jgi:uncharacterized radical SAM superfamily Fe-S cluster-containing enzyme